MGRVLALSLVVALTWPAALWAQDGPAQPIDATKLGVSLDRIRRQLTPVTTRETITGSPFKLNIRIDVFGQAPPIEFFPREFSLTTGPVPQSAPTHREFLEHVTPQEFRAPPFPIYSLAVWAAQKIAERSARSRCEQEVEAYRALVMQGVAVSAPRCTQ